MRQIIEHFTDDDLYKLSMCCAVIDNYPRAQVKYQFVDRSNRVYPQGFAELLQEQIDYLENVVITDEEINFMRRRCTYMPEWFFRFLRGYRFNRNWVSVSQHADGHLHVEFEGAWSDTILLEVKVLAIISELYFMVTGQDKQLDYDDLYKRTYEKGRRLKETGCVFSDFGTRRRASFQAEDTVVRALINASQHADGTGRLVGTSNVWLAMKYDLTPVGTMAHEFVCALGGMYGPQMANHLAMEAWTHTFRGALGTFLYDTYGWNIFSQNFSEDFANMFKGLRIDSGDNYEQMQKICDKYTSLGIDPRTKQVIFSNALDTDSAIEIQRFAQDKVQPSFGIGTHFTCDFPGIEPMNIVIKLIGAKITEAWPFYNDTCKLSEDKGKYTGKPQVVKRFMETLHL